VVHAKVTAAVVNDLQKLTTMSFGFTLIRRLAFKSIWPSDSFAVGSR
jgi:hypothetical protein